ncbi:phage shock protein C (PspC) family protein [Brevibacterium jeotgali]|nr:phage shock protein C (PspC) family protein [Brevibacterium jeotgali]
MATAHTVDTMNAFFSSIRKLGFRRGPQRLAGGISGGLAAATGLNVWLVRLLVLLSFLLPVVGIGLYVVVWVLLPWQDGTIPLERLFGGREIR